ncbi:hypothetical protein FQN54_008808 [Arachnomyces sp. PD_36]|nr:hypothetical protein FQN54_008808 [Arachnomyces sp. PD_36]
MVTRSYLLWLILLVVLSRRSLSAATEDPVRTFVAEDSHGKAIRLRDDRRPALYTKLFGDCQGDSSLNITRFDAGYYKDNMTVAFHFEGSTAVQQDSVMLHIGVFAYGESRFDITLDPCLSNIKNLCPMRAETPIYANGIMPVGHDDVSGIPDIAFSIPDFEGQAMLRVFSNTTQSQIGCYSAVVTNGATFSHPIKISSVLGAFTAIAALSSTVVAIYGTDASSTRTHYAHSLSVFVVLSTFQHIYFTGALSMNWPSILAAFWSNYAWSAGMIYNQKMQDSINQFIGNDRGNISLVGGSQSGLASGTTDGGSNAFEIYHRDPVSRTLSPEILKQWDLSKRAENYLQVRDDAGASVGFPWYGSPVESGLPLPGNYSGFPGILSMERIPASNACMTGFLWVLVLLAGILTAIMAFKWLVEALILLKIVKTDRLALFRQNWLRYTWMAVGRSLFFAFFMMLFLAVFQFALGGTKGAIAIAALVFILFLVTLTGIAGYAIRCRLKIGHFIADRYVLVLEKRNRLKAIPLFKVTVANRADADDKGAQPATFMIRLPWWRIRHANFNSDQPNVHDDEDYLQKFGWLSARFRRTRWWFFAAWLIYELIRACLLGGASGHPMPQIIGLFAIELVALIAMAWMRPFEATRLNALMVYSLGFSKVSTVALASAFYPPFNLERITATVIGVIIIAIQAILTILLLIAIVVGAVSSYISITRHRRDDESRPRSWMPLRVKYIAHVDQKALDLPPPPKQTTTSETELLSSTFYVSSVRRYPKIEDEILHPGINNYNRSESTASIPYREQSSQTALAAIRSRAESARSNPSYYSSPYGVRPARSSISSRYITDTSERITNSGASVSGYSSTSTSTPPLRSWNYTPRNIIPPNTSSHPLTGVAGPSTTPPRGRRPTR